MIKISISERLKEKYKEYFNKYKNETDTYIKIKEELTKVAKNCEEMKNFVRYFCKDNKLKSGYDNKKIEDILLGKIEDFNRIIKEMEPRIPNKNKKVKYNGKEIKVSEVIFKVFNYTEFSKIHKFGYTFADEMKVDVCPYCNRQYTFTVKVKGKTVRPQFDHYYPKGLYPYLAVSLYNLVPCCSICNQSKGEFNTKDKHIFYPYEDDGGKKFKFQTKPQDDDFDYFMGLGDKFNIELIPNEGVENKKEIQAIIDNLEDAFKLKSLYNKHKEYVIHIIRNSIVNNESRIEELWSNYPEIFDSKQEIIEAIFMNYIYPKDWGKRPLAKLTHDICKEFGIISK
ncbi:HNH endonuclease [Clostridium felsineum]|uniref:HNH endonuclease n=1 Tax=Clostridium felsineum TaxID=36839 RepID=UPI00098CA519|nr:hypothetical protein [Clostridium felsineum]URZ04137.1 hypothetical protein CLAUR_042250 [Clostridium felsineum]